MNCLMMDVLTVATTSSPKSTTAVVRLNKTRRHVQLATCKVGRQSSWFQQERSVRTAGPKSTVDIWSHSIPGPYTIGNAAAISAWTRHRRLQLAAYHKVNHWSTRLKCSVDRCSVQYTSVEESWPVSFALSNNNIWIGEIWNPCWIMVVALTIQSGPIKNRIFFTHYCSVRLCKGRYKVLAGVRPSVRLFVTLVYCIHTPPHSTVWPQTGEERVAFPVSPCPELSVCMLTVLKLLHCKLYTGIAMQHML